MPRTVTRREFIGAAAATTAVAGAGRDWPGKIPAGQVTAQAAIRMD